MIFFYKNNEFKGKFEEISKVKFINDIDEIICEFDIFITHIKNLSDLKDFFNNKRFIILDDEYNVGNYLKVMSLDAYYLPMENATLKNFCLIFEVISPSSKVEVVIDDDLGKLKIKDRIISLTTKEMEVFRYLNNRKNVLCLRKDILVDVLGYPSVIDSRIVDVYIRYLRQKLGEEGKYIKTIRGKGYIYERE